MRNLILHMNYQFPFFLGPKDRIRFGWKNWKNERENSSSGKINGGRIYQILIKKMKWKLSESRKFEICINEKMTNQLFINGKISWKNICKLCYYFHSINFDWLYLRALICSDKAIFFGNNVFQKSEYGLFCQLSRLAAARVL